MSQCLDIHYRREWKIITCQNGLLCCQLASRRRVSELIGQRDARNCSLWVTQMIQPLNSLGRSCTLAYLKPFRWVYKMIGNSWIKCPVKSVKFPWNISQWTESPLAHFEMGSAADRVSCEQQDVATNPTVTTTARNIPTCNQMHQIPVERALTLCDSPIPEQLSTS